MRTHHSTLLFIFTLITTLIVLGGLATFFIVLKHKNAETSTVLTTLENKIQKKKNISTLTKKIAEVEPIKNTLDGYFMNTIQIDTFVGYLEEIGIKAPATVVVKSVEVSPAVKNIVIVTLSVEGDFSNVVRALKLLENAPYAIHVQQFLLNKRLQSVAETLKGVTKTRQVPIWHSEIQFTILSTSS